MIIADENVDARIISFLRINKIEVYAIAENCPGISDEAVIALAKAKNLILLTEDKDFGEWVFAHGIKECSIIFLRYNTKEFERISFLVLELFQQLERVDFNYFATVSIDKIRVRKIK